MVSLDLSCFFYIKAEVPLICPPVAKGQLIGKDPDAVKDWREKEKGATEGEMVGWHYWLNGSEFEQTPGDSEGQGSLECCSPWVTKRRTQLSNWATQLKRDFTLWINQWIYSKIRLNWQLLSFKNKNEFWNFQSLLSFYYCSVAKSCLTLYDLWTAACQAPLSSTVSQNLLKFMFVELVMPSNHLTLCCPLLLLP